VIADEYKPAMLWVYRNFVEAYEQKPGAEKWFLEMG
jgi:hypothetical protein